MFTARNKGRLALGAAVVGVALALSGCASGDPLDSGTDEGSGDTITIGSAAYYSNEIIAEIYAQALENAGFDVDRQFNIGQRDVYLPSLENGEVDLLPEYTGNLLQYYDPETTATSEDEVNAALADALPAELTILDVSPATDQDSYNVTAEFAAANGNITSLEDLKDVTVPIILGGPPELGASEGQGRIYGPEGLFNDYGVTVQFIATGDTTYEDLLAGNINLANIYSADPRIATDALVTLEDPKGLFLASNVVPLVNADIADEIADVINAISAKLTPEGLVALNVESTVDLKSPEDIATGWLEENGLL
jgi:osmoprotectant transport system substrate-binding protein